MLNPVTLAPKCISPPAVTIVRQMLLMMRGRRSVPLGRGAVEDERLQRLVVIAAFLAAGEELAVGECAGAALAEGVVRVGVYVEVAVYEGYVLLAGEHPFAALEDYGPEALLYEAQGCEETRGARADDDDLGGAAHVGIIEVQGSRQGLAVDKYLDGDVDLDGAPACVDRAFHDAGHRHVAATYAHLPCRERGAQFEVGGLLGHEGQGNGCGHGISV